MAISPNSCRFTIRVKEARDYAKHGTCYAVCGHYNLMSLLRSQRYNSTPHVSDHKTDVAHWLGQTLASSRALPILQRVQGQEASYQ